MFEKEDIILYGVHECLQNHRMVEREYGGGFQNSIMC